jgi:hypothetical protein
MVAPQLVPLLLLLLLLLLLHHSAPQLVLPYQAD